MAFIDDSRNLAGMTGEARVEDYLALLKPSVMQLVVFTGHRRPGRGARQHQSRSSALIAIVCIAIGAGASARSTCGTIAISTPS